MTFAGRRCVRLTGASGSPEDPACPGCAPGARRGIVGTGSQGSWRVIPETPRVTRGGRARTLETRPGAAVRARCRSCPRATIVAPDRLGRGNAGLLLTTRSPSTVKYRGRARSTLRSEIPTVRPSAALAPPHPNVGVDTTNPPGSPRPRPRDAGSPAAPKNHLLGRGHAGI